MMDAAKKQQYIDKCQATVDHWVRVLELTTAEIQVHIDESLRTLERAMALPVDEPKAEPSTKKHRKISTS